MSLRAPIAVRLPRAFVRRRFDLASWFARTGEIRPAWGWRYRLHPAEARFAQALLRRKSNLWVYRCDQQGYAGDFVIVDMSAPDARHRTAWTVELKRGQRPRQMPRGGVQMRNGRNAGLDVAGVEPTLWLADAELFLDHLVNT